MSTHVLEIDHDLAEIIRLTSCKEADPEAVRRLRERAESFRQQMFEKYGVRDIAVQLVQEARDGK